jgi:sialate O-acetylesterase
MAVNAVSGDFVVTGSTIITLHDVVVGEVWLASGQSNMEWPVERSRGYAEEKSEPANPLVRHLRVEHSPADLPVSRVKTNGWQIAAPDTVGGFTGVGYFFAKALSEKLGVPVGILHSSWGGTPIESWLPEAALRMTKAWPAFDAQWQEAMRVFPQKLAAQPGLEAAWQKAQEENRATGKPITMPWPKPPMAPGSAYGPGSLFNGMIAPLAPYALRGALWYQGEGNVGHHQEYAELLPAMIRSWRAAWFAGDFPVLVVQLPNYSDNGKATGRAWAQLREAQASAVRTVSNVAVAVTIDGDEPDNLHPVNKRPVGERLALLAEAHAYGLAVECCGPTFVSASREGTGMRVKFSYAAGLASRAPSIGGFELAGADKVFHPATARIDGEAVVVSAPEVTAPVAIRYAWSNAPTLSLYNAAGLPAAPFRTDDW